MMNNTDTLRSAVLINSGSLEGYKLYPRELFITDKGLLVVGKIDDELDVTEPKSDSQNIAVGESFHSVISDSVVRGQESDAVFIDTRLSQPVFKGIKIQSAKVQHLSFGTSTLFASTEEGEDYLKISGKVDCTEGSLERVKLNLSSACYGSQLPDPARAELGDIFILVS